MENEPTVEHGSSLIPRTLDVLALVSAVLGVIAVSLYSLIFVDLLIRHIWDVARLEADGIRTLDALLRVRLPLAMADPGSGFVALCGLIILVLFIIAICFLAIMYCVVWAEEWRQSIQKDWISVLNCSWIVSFGACFRRACVTVTETIVWFVVWVLSMLMVLANIVGLFLVIAAALGF